MNSIKEKLLKLEQHIEKNKKVEFKYDFKFNYEEDFVINECIKQGINKEYNIDNKSLKLVLMILKYPKDEVIPFDEYDCLFAIQYENKFINDSLIKSKNIDEVEKAYNNFDYIINSSNIDLIIENILKLYE